MPDSTNDFSTFFSGTIVINATSAREGRSENYLMAGADWDSNARRLTALATVRAMILGRDAEVSYASLSQWGPNRATQCVINSPIPGGLGVMWDPEAYTESALNTNHPSTTLRIRQETAARDNITRQICCIPDGVINASKYTGGAVDGVLDIGAYNTPIGDVDGGTLPTQTLWDYGAPIAGVTTHLLWPAAMKKFLAVLHQYTYWGKPLSPTTAFGREWLRMAYRGVGRVRMGSPILR